MPQVNRDKETLFDTRRLNVWFLATSAVLVVALAWMILGDYWFWRPWKAVQRDFYRRQSGLLAIEKEAVEADLAASERQSAELGDLGAKIAAARAALEEPERARQTAAWTADLAERKALVTEAETRIKAVKGAYSERRYAFEMARQSGDRAKADRLLRESESLEAEQRRWEVRRQDELAERDRLQGLLDEARRPLKDLEARRDAILATVDKTEIALEDARGKTQRDQWRNFPIADIISPTIKIEKVVLDSIHDDFNFATSPKVDMCMTCHAGIAGPVVTEERVRRLLVSYLRQRLGEKAWSKLESEPTWAAAVAPGRLEAWLSGEPRLSDVLPEAKVEAALGGPEAFAKFRDRSMGGKSWEAGGADLLAPFAIRRVEWAHPHLDLMVGPQSPHPMASFGCTTCHEGVGRRLDFARAAHTPEDREQEEAWRREQGWREPESVDYPMLPSRHVQGQCLKCHMPSVQFAPRKEPLLATVAKTNPDGTSEEVRAKAPQPVDGGPASADGRWHPERLEHGERTIREYGCTGCHLIKNFNLHPGFPRPAAPDPGADLATPAEGSLTAWGQPKMGPDLTHVADKTTREFAARWIENPNSYRIDTRMPSFYRFRAHDDAYRVQGAPVDRPLVLDPTPSDLAQIDVETLAIATFLFDGQKVTSRRDQYPVPPAGDPRRGSQVFYAVGCSACHVGPGTYDRDGALVPDDGARFRRRAELPLGPRLTALGSKVDARWLYAWLREPRHYNPVTRMPNMRWRDETGPDGRTVTRTADQVRADVVAYLLQFHDKEFEAREVPDPDKGVRWSPEHERLLKDFWLEWFGKTKPDPKDPTHRVALDAEEAGALAADLYQKARPQMLADVGRKLVGHRGCFGCHNVAGFEHEQPIGKELTYEGSQDVHKFDFGILPHEEVPHTRWDWIENKLREPRLYDKGRYKPRWTDKLRMPKFNFREEDRLAVVTTVLGLVREPIKPAAIYRPSDAMAKVAAGRAVIERYGCNNCHTIEGRYGILTAEQLDRGMELWMLPPNLYGEGNRVKSDWLFRFLKQPFDVRPSVIQRMPMFRLSDEEVTALLDYFVAVAGREDRLSSDPEDRPLDATPYAEPVRLAVKAKDAQGADVEKEIVVHDAVEEAKALFDTFNCVKCHLPKGTPGADPNEGASAPPFTLAGARLRRAWTEDLLVNPQYQIQGTKMVSFWPGKSKRGKPLPPPDSLSLTYPQFLCEARGLADPKNDDVAHAQMKAIVRYLLWHYQAPAAAAPSTPPEPGGK